MRVVPTVFLLIMTLLMAACAGVKCDTPQAYENAKLGELMVVPPGMDTPVDSSVSAIPPGNVGGGQFKDGRCLESAPSFFYGSKTGTVIPAKDDYKIPAPQAGVPEDD